MVTADLREAVMKARMQPVSHVFSKFPRMVRDLAQALDKRVRLQMEGQETELDKSLLEAIKDPLTHAVRNAVDHGIEAPAVAHCRRKRCRGAAAAARQHRKAGMSLSKSSTTAADCAPNEFARRPSSES